jgi:hypothetical protein
MSTVVERPAALVRLLEACRFLRECTSPAEVKGLRDQAQAVATYLRQQRHGLAAQQDACEVKLRAERRLGELLGVTVRAGGDRKSKSHGVTLNGLPEGVSRMQSSRWQREASVPAAAFERYLTHARERGEELTTAAVLDLAKQAAKDRDRLRRLKEARAFRLEPGHRPGRDMGVVTGDVGCLASRLKDGSVDLVVADPPYDPGHLYLYGEVAALAARKLKPGALCLAYCNKLLLPETLAELGRHLTYWWLFAITYGNGSNPIFLRHVQDTWRPVVAFYKPPASAGRWVADHLPGRRREKDLHPWQQPQAEVEYLVEHLTEPGDLVVDPCCGSGTVPAAAQATGRKWLAAEVDPATAALARSRLAANSTGG